MDSSVRSGEAEVQALVEENLQLNRSLTERSRDMAQLERQNKELLARFNEVQVMF